MKKLLVIANLFHASPRIPGITVYFRDFGWDVTIITPALGDDAERRLGFPPNFLEKVRIVEAPYRGDVFWLWRELLSLSGFRKKESLTEQLKERVGASGKASFVDTMMRWYQAVFAYPDTERTWKRTALNAASNLLDSEPFDVILSSSPFPTSNIVAKKLKDRYGLKWVVDFRDPWTLNSQYMFSGLRKRMETALDLKTIKKADGIVAVTGDYARILGTFYQKPVNNIPNGFIIHNDTEDGAPDRKFTITYTGTIYSSNQNPELLLKALKKLLDSKLIDRDDVEVNFYGKKYAFLEAEISRNGLSDVVHSRGTISRKESVKIQRGSQVLLFLNWEDSASPLSNLKFYEYLASRRPILATGGYQEDDYGRILRETGAGICAPTTQDVETALFRLYKEYKQKGLVAYNGDPVEINKYSYRERARDYIEILNSACHGT